ncbi:MAG: quinonprotein alcohol dehydrogenase, partial [Planctomycetota bacterium]
MRTINRTAVLVLCWLMVFSPIGLQTSTAENWPGFRGPTRQGISNEKDLPAQWGENSNIVWKTPIPGDGWSSSIV